MVDFLHSLVYWHWLGLGLVFLIIELCLPASFFLWEGLSALLVGVLTVIFNCSWEVQILLFSVLAPLVTIAGRRFVSCYKREDAFPHLNDKIHKLIGHIFFLGQPLNHGQGQHIVNGALWKVRSRNGEDLPQGRQVRVISIEENVLIIEPCDP